MSRTCILILAVRLMAAALHAAEPQPISPAATFRFGGGERIKVFVQPDTIGPALEQQVSIDGYINLPTGGEPLNIRNKTIPEAVALAAARVGKDSGLQKATAGIALLGEPIRSVFVGGDGIKLSQSVQLTGAPLTLYAAILACGGVAPDGDPTRVSLSRVQDDGSVKVETFDITHFGEAGKTPTLGPLLAPGDTIKIPRGDVFILAGEVLKPGPLNRRDLGVPVGQPVRVSHLVYASGGLKTGANRKNLRLIRTTKDGKREILSVDLDAKPGDDKAAAADPILQDGDTVVASPTGMIAVLGKVRAAGLYPMNGDTVKLSRAIALAGGFGEFAKTSSVLVLKAGNWLNPIHVDMSIQKGFQDMDLEEGDLVFVPERLL
ncbi:MAG TPA: SLBB domain-containing protein [Planctomycetota bacterium]|nr:SLBB domain-containing protein [Planctomycetota bacterium]